MNQEKRNHGTKHIKSLLVNNELISRPEQILETEREFYQNLYKNNDIVNVNDVGEYLGKIESPKITEDTKVMCDHPITMEECSKALNDLPLNKTPGTDGIPIYFYKIFWNEIKDAFLYNLTISKEKGELPNNQKQGVISLIPKEGKDLRELKNWRPNYHKSTG